MPKFDTLDYFQFIQSIGKVEELNQYEAEKNWVGKELYATDGLSCEKVKVTGIQHRQDDNHFIEVDGKIVGRCPIFDINSLEKDKISPNLYSTREKVFEAMTIYLDIERDRAIKSAKHFEERKAELKQLFDNGSGIWQK